MHISSVPHILLRHCSEVLRIIKAHVLSSEEKGVSGNFIHIENTITAYRDIFIYINQQNTIIMEGDAITTIYTRLMDGDTTLPKVRQSTDTFRILTRETQEGRANA